MRLSLISLNTWKCDGEYPDRLRVIGEELSGRTFDFLLGQEVFESEKVSTEQFLSSYLNLPSYYHKSRKKNRMVEGEEVDSYSGLCMWTQLLPQSKNKIDLPENTLDGERISQLLVFKIHDLNIAIINTHLTHLKNESSLRSRQIAHTLAETARLARVDGILFCGDFNAGKKSAEIEEVVTSHAFVDAYPNCLSSHISGNCPDHVFYYPSHRFSISTASAILAAPVKGILPSDHFGIQVELTIHADE